MTLYATPEQLAHYMDPDADPVPAPPANATVLLRTASRLVDEATVGAVYGTDSLGVATSASVRLALAEAAMEQASAWVFANVDPRKGVEQLPRQVASKSANGVSVSYVAYAAADDERRAFASGTKLTFSAWTILEAAGLTRPTITSSRAGHRLPVLAQGYDPLTGALDG